MRSQSLVRLALSLGAIATAVACHNASSSPAPAPSAGATARTGASASAAPYTAAMVTTGDSIFHARSCSRCHGPDAKGAGGGPNLTGPTFLHGGTYPDFVRIVTTGVPTDSLKDKSRQRGMPPRGGGPTQLTDDQIHSVAAYVYSLGHK